MGIAIAAVIIIGAFIVSGILHEQKYWKTLREAKIALWGKEDGEEYTTELLRFIRQYYDSHVEEDDIDEITWNDLEMDEIFCQIDHTCTSMGQEVLYDLLRKPQFAAEELEKRERLIQYFSEHEKERTDLQVVLSGMGKVRRFSVYGYLTKIKELKKYSAIKDIVLQIVFVALIVATILMPEKMILILICFVMYNVYDYFRSKTKIQEFNKLFQFILRMVRFSKELGKIENASGEFADSLKRLVELAESFQSFSRGSFIMVSGAKYEGSVLDAVLDYVRMFFHLDIIKFCSMSSILKKKEDDLFEMYRMIGTLDALVSVASFRAQKQTWCEPELSKEQNPYLYGTSLAHPLIAKPVRNTIVAKGSILITGSNASGKSTFIKAVAVNAILAQTIHTALAEKYASSYMRIYSSMALRDDLLGKESYYIVEIKSLKRIIDKVAEEKPPVLCFIDEVLRGTNTVERIASSTQILSWLAKEGALCFAATHDVELTTLLAKQYTNYHFEEQVEEEEVVFDYQLKEGPAMTRNAIRLLQSFGYDTHIIEGANRQVSQFLDTGIWEE